jgi:GNAT superfamily N-acetyltransferase
MPWTRSDLSRLHELARLQAQLDALEQDIRRVRAQALEEQRAPLHLRSHSAPPMRRAGERVSLRDGSEILIRSIEPGDTEQLEIEFEHLGALSRARGLLSAAGHLSAAQLQRLTSVDHTTHEALVALEPVRGEGVGTARFVQVPGERTRATATVVVADVWQGRGVGTALAERLAARARSAGFEQMSTRMIVGDVPGARLARHLGRVVGERSEDGITELTIELGAGAVTRAPAR